MLFKWRLAIGLSLFSGLLTLIICLINHTRLFTALFRLVITLLLVGCAGILSGELAERYYIQLKNKVKPKGQNVDIMSENQELDMAEATSLKKFTPFTPDNFEKLVDPNREI